MSTQPEDLLRHMDEEWQEDWNGQAIRAELRRLHALNTELLEALNRLHALNAELLESLLECVEDSEQAVTDYVLMYGENHRPKRLEAMRETVRKARAAIAKAEGA